MLGKFLALDSQEDSIQVSMLSRILIILEKLHREPHNPTFQSI